MGQTATPKINAPQDPITIKTKWEGGTPDVGRVNLTIVPLPVLVLQLHLQLLHNMHDDGLDGYQEL